MRPRSFKIVIQIRTVRYKGTRRYKSPFPNSVHVSCPRRLSGITLNNSTRSQLRVNNWDRLGFPDTTPFHN